MEESRLKFLADEHVSPIIVRILHAVGEKSILRFTSNFANGTPDEQWIPEATKRGFVCVSYDRNMLLSNAIAPFFVQEQARVIFIGSHLANAGVWDQALWILKYWRKIRDHAATMKPGQLARVHKNGRITAATPKVTESN